MQANSSPRNPPKKRSRLARYALWLFQLLLMFWLTILALLIVVGYGLRAGWSTPGQWSDGFFIAAIAQVLIAAASMGQQGEAFYASSVRYVSGGNYDHARDHLFSESSRLRKFGVRAVIGAVLTVLVSAVFLLK